MIDWISFARVSEFLFPKLSLVIMTLESLQVTIRCLPDRGAVLPRQVTPWVTQPQHCSWCGTLCIMFIFTSPDFFD